MTTTTAVAKIDSGASEQLVTMRVGKQVMGIPVQDVREILREQKVTHIPLVSGEIAGVLNLRGRIVTAIDVRYKMKLPPREAGRECTFVVVENKGELYSLIVDSVGDVLTIPSASIEKSPPNLASNWREVSSGVYKLENELLVILDHKALFTFGHH